MCDYCSWVEKLLSQTRRETRPITSVCTNVAGSEKIGPQDERREDAWRSEPTILIHGSAISASTEEEMNELLGKIVEAAIKGYGELLKGEGAVDSIEAAIRHLESDGSTGNEVPAAFIKAAAIMESDCSVGSVGAIVDAPHPAITLAKKVLRNTDHALVVGNGAGNLEAESDVVFDPNDRYHGENFEGHCDESNAGNTENARYFVKGLRIFGGVARDKRGRLACGVSTLDDRADAIEGSSLSAAGTVIGCGIFADAHSCCSVSGRDATIYAYAPARRVVERLKRETRAGENNSTELSMEEALESEMETFLDETGESLVGMAAVSIESEARVAFARHYFPWARCHRGAVTSGFVRDRVSTREIKDLEMPLDCKCA